ncbi:uncharacterized protein GBIM_01651, partial [Gryllus bimaculatus]
MATRICKGNKSVLKEFHQVVEDMKNASRSSLSLAASATYAVQEALRKERLQALRGLLDAGASPVAPSGYLNETPLHMAATFSNSSCTLELLERGADPNARDKNGETPMHRAARHGRPAVLSVLLCHGGAHVNARCLSKETPLCYAIYYRHAHCVVVLLENGADVKIKDALGLTPLHTAVSANDHIALVHLLLKWDADPEAQTNSGEWLYLSLTIFLSVF